MNLRNKGVFHRDIRAFTAEHSKALEVRIGLRGQLHDRYLIHAAGALLIGTSLNSLGLKQAVVVALGSDIRASVERSFNDAWANSTGL